LINRGVSPVNSIIARVTVAGVGHPVGVLGLMGRLRISPYSTSSESRFGVSRVFSGVPPAPDIPGTVDRIVLPNMTENTGCDEEMEGISQRKAIAISI
jgi:hypothetical protein